MMIVVFTFLTFPPAAVDRRFVADIVGCAFQVKRVGNRSGFLPEYMRRVAWKSARRLIRGIGLSQPRKAVAKPVAIHYIVA
jgi:hypothetical protein